MLAYRSPVRCWLDRSRLVRNRLEWWAILLCTRIAVKIWEFTPYQVEVWCSLDSDLNVSTTAQSHFIKALGDNLDRNFQSAWRTRVELVDEEQRSRIARHLDSLKLEDFTREELALVINRDPAHAAVRTLGHCIGKDD